VNACDACLRRAHLLGLLGPRIARLGRPGERPRSGRTRLLLALPDEQLIHAVAANDAAELSAALERFRPAAMRTELARRALTAVCRHDPGFPAMLLPLDDGPRALFVRGDPGRLHELAATPAVAIVGGRGASTYALEVAHELARGLAVAGIPVVSGLALGVDAAAHRGALAGGGLTVAVLASGADVAYPARHRTLYDRIALNGVVLSEMPPGTRPRRWAFPARNRIMAGLAEMTVVAEAAEASGSLITATFAAETGRGVGAVPGRVNAVASAGSNRLLADGAVVVLGVRDILDHVFGVGVRPLPPPPRVELDPAAQAVLGAVEAGESPVAAPGVAIKDVRAALGRLEGLGLVRRDGLGGYERTGAECRRA
jgi:DNA processing protein